MKSNSIKIERLAEVLYKIHFPQYSKVYNNKDYYKCEDWAKEIIKKGYNKVASEEEMLSILDRIEFSKQMVNDSQEKVMKILLVRALVGQLGKQDICQEDVDFIWSLMPDWIRSSHKRYDPTLYGTGTYKGDIEVRERVDKILGTEGR